MRKLKNNRPTNNLFLITIESIYKVCRLNYNHLNKTYNPNSINSTNSKNNTTVWIRI